MLQLCLQVYEKMMPNYQACMTDNWAHPHGARNGIAIFVLLPSIGREQVDVIFCMVFVDLSLKEKL